MNVPDELAAWMREEDRLLQEREAWWESVAATVNQAEGVPA